MTLREKFEVPKRYNTVAMALMALGILAIVGLYITTHGGGGSAEEKKLQDESIKLQRAYYIEQQKLQRESAGISAYGAQVQKDLNDAMLAYNDYAQQQKGYLELAATSMSTLQTAIENLTDAIKNGGLIEPATYTPPHYYKDNLNNSRVLTINLDGREVGRYVLQELE